MNKNFSYAVQKVMLVGEDCARDLSHPLVGSEHILLALIKCGDNPISEELIRLNVKYKVIYEEVKKIYKYDQNEKDSIDYSFEIKQIIEAAGLFSSKSKENSISMNSFIFTMINLKNTASDLLTSLGANIKSISNKILDSRRKKSELANIQDLHLMGIDNKDPLIGRENEIRRLIVTLSRRNKPNAILIGEPGVGKTAIIEELARRLLKNEIPSLKGKTIYELDIASTVSGTKYRGEFEEKLKKILKKVIEEKSVILFIDEVHNIVKAGGAEGAIDASNILKPYLARANIQLIGATTFEEFNATFEKDKALKRRFQIININENSLQDTKQILCGIKPIYEDYYHLSIDDEIVDYICECANEYMMNQKFPDKAIELLDNSCVQAINKLSKEDVDITLKEIFNVKPIKNKIDDLKNELKISLYNQDKIIEELANSLEKEERLIMFVGGNGVGKSTTCNIVSKTLFNNENLIIECLDFTEKPMYNGLKDNFFGIVNKLKQNSQTLVVFKNFEMINEEYVRLLTSSIQKGYVLDNNFTKIPINNTVFIFCVNANSNSMEFEINKDSKTNISKSIKATFGIEFTLLLDKIINFKQMDEKIYGHIVEEYLDKHNIRKKEFDLSSTKQERIKYGGKSAIEFAKEIAKEN